MHLAFQKLLFACATFHLCRAGILLGQSVPNMGNDNVYNDDEWEPVYRVYQGDDWDSHDDYLSKEKSARYGDKDDSQFRSWKIDQWHHTKIHKVRIELYDDGDEVAEFEFEGTMQNLTSFFSPRNLRSTNYIDIPTDGSPFPGDDFSFDGDDDSRHWTVSSRHVGDCRNDEGWIQVIDRPKPGRDRCVCGYENVAKYPTIMYAKGNKKTKWSDPRAVGYADMMQIKVSTVPYPVAAQPVQLRTAQPMQLHLVQQQPSLVQYPEQPAFQRIFQFEAKK